MNTCRFFLILATSLLAYVGSFSQHTCFITVKFEGASENDSVYLQSTKSGIGSTAIVNKVAKFSLSMMDDEWIAYFITYKGKERRFDYSLFHNAKSDVVLTIDKEFGISTISGNTNANDQNEYYKGLMTIFAQYKALQNESQGTDDAVRINMRKNMVDSFEQRYKEYNLNWISKHRASPFSVAVIRLYMDKSNVLNALDVDAARCFDSLLPQAKADNYEAYILQRDFAKYDEKYSSVILTKAATPFVIKDTVGNNITLENFKGKWLLIDFWASWCGPCRQNNPLLKKLCATYRSKGLEVLSISVDTDNNEWRKAIRKDKMGWHQGSDLLGQDAGVGKTYQISAVPVYYLVSPDGVIVAESVGGDIHKMEEIFKQIFKQ